MVVQVTLIQVISERSKPFLQMIPRILHQIWLGDQAQRPDRWLQSVRGKHPGWDYHLWTELNLPTDLLVLRQYVTAHENGEFNKAADFLRFELLYRYGGIYIDADMLCVRSLEPLLNNTFFIAEEFDAEESLYLEFPRPYLGTGVLGSIPEGEIVQALLRDVLHLDEAYVRTSLDIACAGPVYVTRTLQRLGQRSDLTIYPSRTFYPHHPMASYGFSRDPTEAYTIHQWGHTMGYGMRRE